MSLQSLALIENWPVPTAAAAVVRADGTVLGTHGPIDHRFPLASVTKPLAAYAALVAYEEGAIELDTTGLTLDQVVARIVALAGTTGAAGHCDRPAGRSPGPIALRRPGSTRVPRTARAHPRRAPLRTHASPEAPPERARA